MVFGKDDKTQEQKDREAQQRAAQDQARQTQDQAQRTDQDQEKAQEKAAQEQKAEAQRVQAEQEKAQQERQKAADQQPSGEAQTFASAPPQREPFEGVPSSISRGGVEPDVELGIDGKTPVTPENPPRKAQAAPLDLDDPRRANKQPEQSE